MEFPIQIIIRSKKLDIDDYVDQVKERGDKQENKLLQEQTYEYAQYIKKLVEYADIMEKEFYVVIPYDPERVRGTSFFQSFIQRLSPKDTYSDVKKRHAEFNQLKKALTQRVSIVSAGLENCGLKTNELDTQELIEIFYNSYNPSISRSSKIKNVDDINVETDEKSE